MKTRAALSLFVVAPALLIPAVARAQVPQMPEPYQPPPADAYGAATDPYDSAADPAQIDWPQDIAAEEDAVDSYDDGYDPQAYTQFQDALAPYGDWIDDGTYGRVWVPASSVVGSDFTPYYTGGHWLLTEYGWTWVSDWNWGWAPFHYGRWILVSGFGWAWVPGTMWGPAWVAWRYGGGYVGWAALPPRGISITATYGHRSPWRFTRAADLWVGRPRTVPVGEMREMFRRTRNVANDRVLTRGDATVHINAGPRYVPGATVARLKAVAPHAFPQRAILPRPGANMSARPWIRAASAPSGGAPAPGRGGAVGAGIGARGGMGPSGAHTLGRSSPGHLSAAPAPAPHIYNPPRPTATTNIYSGTSPRTYAPSPAPTTGPRVFDATPANNAPRFNRPALPHRPPQATGTSPAHDSARVYNPGPRTFDTPATINPGRSFSGSAAGVYNPPPRTFAAPSADRAPLQPFRQMHAPPQAQVAPAHSFNRPAPAPAPARSFSAPTPAPVRSFSAPSPAPARSFNVPAAAPAARSFGGPAAGGGFGRPGGGAPLGHRR